MNKSIQALSLLTALVLLGGCVAVPVQPGYYEPRAAVYVPAPVYYGPPAYYGPSVRFGVYGGWHGHRRH